MTPPKHALTPGRDLESATTHVDSVRAALGRLDVDALHRIADRMLATHRARGVIYCMGNGGSATNASHLAADLGRLTRMPGLPRQMKVTSLTDNAALLTACANDSGYEHAFAEQLHGTLEPQDLLLGLSTSGASANVLTAFKYARELGISTAGITGESGAAWRATVDEAVVIESSSVQVIEDVTLVALHTLCLLARERRLAAGV